MLPSPSPCEILRDHVPLAGNGVARLDGEGRASGQRPGLVRTGDHLLRELARHAARKGVGVRDELDED